MRFYEPDICAENIGNSYQLNTENSHHLAHVLRAKIGICVVVFNGKSGEFNGVISSIEKKSVIVNITSFSDISRTQSPPIDLVFTLSVKTKMNLIIQKATELAVSNLYPIQTEFGQGQIDRYTEQSTQRYEKVIIAAAMQCGLNVLPTLHPPCLVQDLPWSAWDHSTKLVCHPGVKSNINPKNSGRVIWFIGPEGGWSNTELLFFKNKKCDYYVLAPTVLRMETACIAALSQKVC